ncbi:MAG: acetylxylan esterase [Vicinamibacteria bacterium]|nr:acetylxylan esterase [Vicinamibacteria bacterium]
MTRSVALVLTTLCALRPAPAAPPAEAFTVLVRQPDGPRITPYLAYQTEMAWRQDDARRAALASIRTEGDLLRLQVELRAKLLRMLGGLPSTRTPLNAQVTGRIQMTGFHIEKLVFESLPGIFVTALVYVPDRGRRPHPAVLVASGHSANGKTHYQALCQRLAARGYVVISWDPVGQGERSQFWDAAAKKSRYNLICGEHAVLGNLAYLAGTNLARWEVWDGMRALDYLLTRPEVDPARISITGTSGGGLQAAMIAALDPRIRVAAPSCYITALPMRMSNRIFEDPDSDPEQDPYGMIADGVDHAGLLVLMYPRPVFVAAAALDFFPIEGTRRTFREVAAVYRRFGHPDRIAMHEGYHKHDFSVENQAAAFRFLDRFNGVPADPRLATTTTLDDEALRCTRTGQVLLDHVDGRNLMDEIRDYYNAHVNSPRAPLSVQYFGPGYPGVSRWRVAPYEGSDSSTRQIQWEAAGTSAFDGVSIDRYVLHHSGGLAMPLLHLHSEGTRGRRVLLWVSDRGKADARDWSAMQQSLADGYDVVSFDGRASGETRMRYTALSIDDPSLAQKDFDHAYTSPLSGVLANYVYNALLTGRPYMLQMVEDVEIAARFARLRLGATDISITATGDAYTLAHDAADILPGLRLLPDDNAHVLSWAQLVKEKQEVWPIQYTLPGGAYVR